MKAYKTTFYVMDSLIPYLVNRDATGLSEYEKAAVDVCCADWSAESLWLGAHSWHVSVPDSEPEFCRCDILNQMGQVREVDIVYLFDGEPREEAVKHLEEV